MNAWEKNVRKVTPYTPGEQPKVDDVIKLNTNECPYPPSPKVVEALENMNKDKLRVSRCNCRILQCKQQSGFRWSRFR